MVSTKHVDMSWWCFVILSSGLHLFSKKIQHPLYRRQAITYSPPTKLRPVSHPSQFSAAQHRGSRTRSYIYFCWCPKARANHLHRTPTNRLQHTRTVRQHATTAGYRVPCPARRWQIKDSGLPGHFIRRRRSPLPRPNARSVSPYQVQLQWRLRDCIQSSARSGSSPNNNMAVVPFKKKKPWLLNSGCCFHIEKRGQRGACLLTSEVALHGCQHVIDPPRSQK